MACHWTINAWKLATFKLKLNWNLEILLFLLWNIADFTWNFAIFTWNATIFVSFNWNVDLCLFLVIIFEGCFHGDLPHCATSRSRPKSASVSEEGSCYLCATIKLKIITSFSNAFDFGYYFRHLQKSFEGPKWIWVHHGCVSDHAFWACQLTEKSSWWQICRVNSHQVVDCSPPEIWSSIYQEATSCYNPFLPSEGRLKLIL